MAAGWHESDHVIELRPSGPGRVLAAPFLMVWLAGWAAGEVAVISVLVVGAQKLLRGEEELTGSMLGIAAFLTVWLTFWTIGGVCAIRELLRMLWAVDQIAVNPAGIGVLNRLGPFRSTREVRRDELVGVGIEGRQKALVAETRAGSVRLATLGTLLQREGAARELRERLGLQDAAAQEEWTPVALPEGWVEAVDAEGRPVLVRDPAARRKHARLVGLLALVGTISAAWLVGEALGDSSVVALATILALADAGLVWGALWLAHGRDEWRLESGLLRLRRRFGRRVRDVFEAHALELSCGSDGDGDEWIRLDALDRESAQEEPSGASLREASRAATRRRRGRRVILRSMNETRDVRSLARWLAERAQVPLRDLTTTRARQAQRETLRRQLREAGALGRFVGRLLDRAEARRGSG